MTFWLAKYVCCSAMLFAACPSLGLAEPQRGDIVMLDGLTLAAGSGVVLEHDATSTSIVTATHNLVDCVNGSGLGPDRLCRNLRVSYGPSLTALSLPKPLISWPSPKAAEISIITTGDRRRAFSRLRALSSTAVSNAALTCSAYSRFLNIDPNERPALTKQLGHSLQQIRSTGRAGYRPLRFFLDSYGAETDATEANRLAAALLLAIDSGDLDRTPLSPIEATYTATPDVGIWQITTTTSIHYQANGRLLVGCDGWEGSSGGGVFDVKGKLVGIIQGGVGVFEKAFRGRTQSGVLWYSGFATLKKETLE